MKDKFYWVTLSDNGHFRRLTVTSNYANIADLEDFIVFKTEAEAENFKSKLQDFIINNSYMNNIK